MSRDTYYFSHDYNARNDTKIKSLIRKHGLLGYGLFWAIVEELYNNANALPTDYESIAYDLRTDLETVKSIINDFDLFVIDGNTFGSLSIERRLGERSERSGKARVSAEKRWAKHREQNANAMQTHSEGNAIKESKEKDIKESKEIKEKEKEGNFDDFEILSYPTFEDFWNLYDYKKGDKEKIKKKFDVLSQETKEEIMNYLPNYILSTPEKQYRKYPETFINNKSWKDEIIFKENGKQSVTDKGKSELAKVLAGIAAE